MSDFDTILDERLEKTKQTLSKKKEEYATATNRYHNFDEAARIIDCSPEKALYGMFMKHLVSIQDMVNRIDATGKKYPNDYIDEKIGDTINYLIFLEGLMKRE